MNTFNLGDIIIFNNDSYYQYKIISIPLDNRADIECIVSREGGYKGKIYYSNGLNTASVFIKNNNKTNMSLISKIKLLKKGEPEKSNIKAGLRTVDDEFTPEGKDAFIEFLYQVPATKQAFKTEVADPINAENDKSE